MIGFAFDTEHNPYTLLFDEKKLRESPGFQELWALDYPWDSLSMRRRNSVFGWINETGFQ